MKIVYRSNNSGGDWWLSDQDWYALEKAGWTVDWEKKGRFLGALATAAWKDFESMDDAEIEFAKITNQNLEDKGCSCCGQPHYFYVKDD